MGGEGGGGGHIVLRTFITHLVVHMHQKKKIAVDVATANTPFLVLRLYCVYTITEWFVVAY
jgi:hypothetical protein